MAALAALLVAPVFAQVSVPRKSLSQLVSSVWTTTRGLPQNTINDLLQSSDGFLWIATQEGVARFDGVQFTTFDRRRHRAIPTNHVNVLCEGSGGDILLGTNAGLAIIRGDRVVPGPASLHGVPVRALQRDRDGTIWIGSARGLFSLRNGTIEHRRVAEHSIPNIRALLAARDGTIWIGTEERGLFAWTDSGMTRHDGSLGLEESAIVLIHEDARGMLWVGASTGGLYRRTRRGAFEHVRGSRVQPLTVMHDIAEDNSGQFWVGTSDGLLRIVPGDRSPSVHRYGTGDGLPGISVFTVLVDREGSLWTGTFGKGLAQFTSGNFVTHGPEIGIGTGVIFSVAEDRDGQIWIGTEEHGAIVLDGEQRRRALTTAQGLPENAVFSIEQGPDGAMWLGTLGGGVAEVRNGSVARVYDVDNGLPNNFVRALRFDNDGYLWIGTRNGLCRMKQGLIENYSASDGLTSLFIRTIVRDRRGRMWIGTLDGGIVWHDAGRFSHLTADDGLPLNDVWAVHEDHDGTMWFGTNGGGLVRYRNDSLVTITSDDGLFDDVILTIQEDMGGYLWMTSNHGVTRVSRHDLNAVADGNLPGLQPASFGRADGMRSDECSGGQPAGLIDSDGQLWIPTTDGIVTVQPAHLRENLQRPLVSILTVTADATPVQAASGYEIPAGTQRIVFAYTAVSFLASEKIIFRFRLEGHDPTWVEARTQRTATYTNVPPGEYRFLVQARNADGVWSDRATSPPIVVRARMYEARWFQTLVAAVVVGLIALTWRARVRSHRMREAELQRLVDERTHELREQKELADQASEFKSHLLDFASHDLKSPLISIRGFAQIARDEKDLSGDARESVDAIHRLAQSTLSLINELLDASAIEHGHIQLQRRPTNLADMAESVSEILRSAATRKQQTLHLQVHARADCIALADPVRVQTVIENLLTNAMKFSPPGSNVWVAVEPVGSNVRLSVRDEGPGMSLEDKKHLFEMFATLTARPTGGEPSTGIGLTIVKRLVELHGGAVFVDSSPGHGSTFFVDLPRVP